MNNQTSCWECSAVFPMQMHKCPQCGSTNANADFETALTEMNHRRQNQERRDDTERDSSISVAYAEAQAEIGRLRGTLEQIRRECDRAWREVDAIARERDEHLKWRGILADKLHALEGLRGQDYADIYENSADWDEFARAVLAAAKR